VHNFCSGLRKPSGVWERDGESWPLALDPKRSQSVAYRSVLRCGVRRTLRIDNVDYLVLQISGISFVLHQIRHMVGTALAIAHGLVPADILPLALRSPLEVNISPLAPATGLLLDQVHAAARPPFFLFLG
jgi:tRNA U38,U39,U40 pseudouridine synthase TruA